MYRILRHLEWCIVCIVWPWNGCVGNVYAAADGLSAAMGAVQELLTQMADWTW